MPRRTITWNTGRHYTREGQVITAQVREDGIVLFNDHSRMVSHYLAAPAYPMFIESEEGLKRYVMDKYDRYEYGPITDDITRAIQREAEALRRVS